MKARQVKLYGSFAVVYFVWGSSFLAGHIGVQDLPPLLFSAGRSLLAGLLLLSVALYRGERMPNTRREWLRMVFFALTLIVLNNGAAMHGLQHLPSNEVALLNASVALWIAGLGTIGPRGQPLTPRSAIGLLLGFGGVVLLIWRGEFRLDAHFGWQMLVLSGCVWWAIGTIVYRNSTILIEPVAFNAVLMLFGATGLLLGGLAKGELAQWQWSANGLWAMVYLAVFGSALAYTAYTWLIKNARTDRVATFAYVNPAIAALLGWLVLGESLAPAQLAGMTIVLMGVALVTLPTRIA